MIRTSVVRAWRFAASLPKLLCGLVLLVAASAAHAANADPNDPALNILHPPSSESMERYDLAIDAPVLVLFGQSNALGSGALMSSPADQADLDACRGMPNVKALRRDSNRVAGKTSAVWGAYTCGGTNLGEEYGQGLAYNTVSAFALRWQRAINAGMKLPDLHVIHIAWSSQGVQEGDSPTDRWWMARDASSVESLHPFAVNTLANALQALRAQGKRPRIIGLHWNQWECEPYEQTVASKEQIKEVYRNTVGAFRAVAGSVTFPIYFYRPRSIVLNRGMTQQLIDALTELASEPGANAFQLLDPAAATDTSGARIYNPGNSPNFGIFSGDGIHQNRAVQQWWAQKQWEAVFHDGGYGAPAVQPVNVALGRPATQSSVEYGGVAARAVDGNSSGSYASNTITHTGVEANPWWQVDLGASKAISTIVLARRTECCDERLANFSVFVSATDMTGRSYADLVGDAAVWRYRVNGAAPAQFTVPAGVSGRYVRVQLAGTGILQLSEVAVNTASAAYYNVAFGKSASASSVGFNTVAYDAIDGNTDGNFDHGSVVHTNYDANPWWQVDLGATYTLDRIVIYNRTDCCAERMAYATTFISRTDPSGRGYWELMNDPAVIHYQFGAAPPAIATINTGGGVGRYVRVQLPGSNYLNIAEVKMMGSAAQ